MSKMVNWQVVVDRENTELFEQTVDWLRMFFTNEEDNGSYIRFMNKLPENESKVVEEYLADLPNLHILQWTGTMMLACLRKKEFMEMCDKLEGGV